MMKSNIKTRRVQLFDGKDVIAHTLECGSEKVIVSFQPWSAIPFGEADAKDAHGFGETVFSKHGYDEIHITPRCNNWYQTPEMAQVIKLVKERVGSRAGVTYGSSMGGYGAVAFSGPLNLPCVALTPQFSIDQEIVPFETRWQNEAAKIIFDNTFLGQAPRARGYVFYDNIQPLERGHAELIQENTDCRLVPCPYTGHAITTHLNTTFGLRKLVTEVIDGKFDIPTFRRVRRTTRKSEGVYLSQLIRGLLARKKRQAAVNVYNNLVDLDKTETRELFFICKAFAQSNDLETAHKIRDIALARGMLDPASFYQLAGMYRALRDEDGFAALAKDAAIKFPTNKKVLSFLDRIRPDMMRYPIPINRQE